MAFRCGLSPPTSGSEQQLTANHEPLSSSILLTRVGPNRAKAAARLSVAKATGPSRYPPDHLPQSAHFVLYEALQPNDLCIKLRSQIAISLP